METMKYIRIDVNTQVCWCCLNEHNIFLLNRQLYTFSPSFKFTSCQRLTFHLSALLLCYAIKTLEDFSNGTFRIQRFLETWVSYRNSFKQQECRCYCMPRGNVFIQLISFLLKHCFQWSSQSGEANTQLRSTKPY